MTRSYSRRRDPKYPRNPATKHGLPLTGVDILNLPLFDKLLPSTKRGGNSKYKGRDINLNDVRVWEDFWNRDEIAIWETDPVIGPILTRELAPDEMTYFPHKTFPLKKRMRNEITFERASENLRCQLNCLLWLCAKEIQGTETPIVMQIDDGEDAQWMSPDAEANANLGKPDYAGYLYDAIQQEDEDCTQHIYNRIPGDAKMYNKINHSMLPPYKDGNIKRKTKEAQKVLKQIHGYMDCHEARYGYLLTEKELITLRRRDTGWGQIDVAPPVPHHWPSKEKGKDEINSKYVLFYLHWVVANDDSPTGWRLRSFGQSSDVSSDSPTPSDIKKSKKKRASLLKTERVKRDTECRRLIGEMRWNPLSWFQGYLQTSGTALEKA